MKNKHQIWYTFDTEADRCAIVRRFIECGVPKLRDERFLVYYVTDDQPNWPCIRQILTAYPQYDSTTATLFTADEIAAVEWSALRTAWTTGYPQPENDFKFHAMTYDLSAYCPQCGRGARQRHPFRMKREITWDTRYKHRYILQMWWVFDAFFVRPEVWETVFKPLGIACRPVLKGCTDTVLESVVQLNVEDVLPGPIAYLDRYPYEDCSRCGQRKYHPICAGYFPPMTAHPPSGIHLACSQEYFGSGTQAFRGVFISRELFSQLCPLGLEQLELLPVAYDDSHLHYRWSTSWEKGQWLV